MSQSVLRHSGIPRQPVLSTGELLTQNSCGARLRPAT